MTFQQSSYPIGIEEDVLQTRFLYFSVKYKSTISILFYFFPLSFFHTPTITRIISRFKKIRVHIFSNSDITFNRKSSEITVEFCCRKMSFRRLLIITALIVLPIESYALSPLYSFRHLYEQTRVSPLPSSSYGVNLASGGSNNGESHQHVKMTILPAKNTIKKINITSHQIKKAKISLGIDFSSTIALTPSDGNHLISTAAAPSPENRQQKYTSSGTYITPTNGAYLAILLLIIGGSLTFFKLRTRGRHLEGVPYHELEMGNSTALNMEENETENWGQDWNDEWGDEKPVKSGGDNHVLVKQANNIITKLPNSNGRKKERND